MKRTNFETRADYDLYMMQQNVGWKEVLKIVAWFALCLMMVALFAF